jgi:hypothetical protein
MALGEVARTWPPARATNLISHSQVLEPRAFFTVRPQVIGAPALSGILALISRGKALAAVVHGEAFFFEVSLPINGH